MKPNHQRLQSENAELRARLEETEETLRAIRNGEVDAILVGGADEPQVFILQSTDAEANRFRSDILAKVNDAVIAIDEEQHVIYLNAAAERQYQISASWALGRKLREIYQTSLPGAANGGDDSAFALAKTGQWIGTQTHIKQSGETIQVEASVSRLLAADGSPAGQLSVIRDVTDRSLAEEALRASEERYRTLFNSIDEGFCIIEMIFDDTDQPVDYLFLQTSPSFERQSGMVNVTGRRMREMSPEHEDAWFEIYGEVAKTGKPIRFEKQAKGLSKWFDVFASRFGDPEKRQVAVVFSDVTERKQAEESLRTSERALRMADKSKDEFLAMLAHELRNPLAPLRNATEILQEKRLNPQQREQAQGIMVRQIENMSRMIDDLLDVSRITEGKIELRKKVVVLQDIFASAEAAARPGCEANKQKLTVSIQDEPILLHADATRLEQVLGNLLGNACKYSGESSDVILSAELLQGEAGREVAIRISDNGIGIDPETLPRIFDLFVQGSRTLDRAQGGLGIGLTIVHRLVKLHGGSIEAESGGSGHGTAFTVRLPVLDGDKSVPAPAPERADGARSLRMLIVDDNEDAAESMAMFQELTGHQTRTAFTAEAALETATEFLPEVVLLDIGLPGMNGFEVVRRLRKMPELQDTFFIALTGYGAEEDRRKAIEAGFDEHLAKPADLELLRDWLRQRFPSE